ncbi:prephenate dehydrogenase/arogenate dehydrogenase family protein [Micromonospora sp. 15K316]|nr:prephenate dehydrogenase/arogenate dehydrogenase family protein [Micromonospora sp. 15K316]
MDRRPRVAVVGTGLIGGSILLRLREAYPDVVGWDPDAATRAAGRDRGVRFPDELADALRDRDVVFLAGPLASLPETLRTVASQTGDHCVVTDVGSTKGAVARFAAEQGLTGRFVPGHPMAGTERSGLTAAVPGLFDGAAWVLCPSLDGIGPFRLLADLLVAVFAARVVPMSPTAHDSVVALSSHVPHLLAGSLAGAAAEVPTREAVLGLAAGSFRDGTRVVGTPVERIADMLFQNRDQVLDQLGQVRLVLDELVDALRRDDPNALVERYRQAQELRRTLFDRRLDEHRREFPAGGDHAAELAYLLELGSAGGHLAGCHVGADVVTYLARRPAA